MAAEPTTPQLETEAPLRFFLGEDDFDGEVLVSLESFLMFDNEITHGLDELERRWADWSTPDSLRRDLWADLGR